MATLYDEALGGLMQEVLIALLKRYGPIVIAAAIGLGILTWSIAHYFAAPGTSVSILWGLVQYTKVPTSELKQREERGTAIISSGQTSHKILVVDSPTRVYLRARPKEMRAMVSNLTHIQAALFEEKTLAGKWMRINGPVADILGGSSKDTWLVFYIDGVITRVIMKKGNVERVSHLVKGDIVTVDGKFRSMDSLGPDFEEGELVSTP